NEKLQDKSSIKIAEDKEEITGGFILKKPKKEINCSFKSLIEEKRNDLKVKISRILFGNDIS
ncbi:MAG: V-type ATP synthase subunit E, partial [Candidatus Omnitrophica bacterium]|nr:V-type ATP synthase subunit E [Candidatus Omnitrophota bacterium]